MKKSLSKIIAAAFLAVFAVGYADRQAVAQINVSQGIAQGTADALVELMSRWNSALSDVDGPALTEIYVPEDRDYVQELIRGRGKAVGTGVDVKSIEKTGPDAYRIRFVRFWGGAKPGRANVAIEAVQVNDKFLLKVPAAQKSLLSQRTSPAAVTSVPEPSKAKVAEIGSTAAPEASAKAAQAAPAAPSAPAVAASAQPAPPPAPVTPSAASPAIVMPKAPSAPLAPLVVTTDTKPRVAEQPAAPAATTTPAASPAPKAETKPAATAAATATPETPKVASAPTNVRLGPGVDKATADSILELIAKWNVALADVNTADLVAIHVPEDKDAVEKMASTRGKSVDSKASVSSIEKVADGQFRVRVVRSWGGSRPGKTTNVLDVAQRDGKVLLRINKAQAAASAKRAAAPAPAAPPVAKTEPAPAPAESKPVETANTTTPAAKPAAGASATAAPAALAAAAPAATPAPTQTTDDPSKKVAASAAPKKPAAPTRAAPPAAKAEAKTDASVQSSVVNIDGSVRYVFAKVGHATLVKLPISATRVAVGDPNILDFTMINPRELYVLGKSVGTTNMILWESSGRSIVVPAAVNVDLEPLSASMREALPQEQDVKISSIAGSIVLGGSVSDGLAAKTAVDLADAFVGNLNRQIRSAAKLASGAQDGQQQASGSSQQNVASLRVIDLLRLRDSQQVMLDVRIAEIQKGLLEQLGVRLNRPNGPSDGGRILYSILSSFPFTTNANGSISYTNVNTGLKVTIDAEKRDTMVKILAEPTLVGMSGQEGSFLAGGTIFVPGGRDASGAAAPPVEKEYGVSLKFLPTVLDGGRINLRVAPEVSEIANTSPTDYPAFTTRKVTTTVQLRNGQTLMIGGLLKSNLTQAVKAMPILGELPIIGALFRSSEYIADRTELVVIVSPSLVKPTEIAPTLPTDNFEPPSRSEFFFQGSMEKK